MHECDRQTYILVHTYIQTDNATGTSVAICGIAIAMPPNDNDNNNNNTGSAKKPDHFLMLITLRWLVVEKRVICQKFANFV